MPTTIVTVGLTRVLALDPTSKGFGYVILERPGELVDWGLKEARLSGPARRRRCLRQVRELVRRYAPGVLVVEEWECPGARLGERACDLLAHVAQWASPRLEVARIPRLRVRQLFAASDARTKDEIARVIARELPELSWRLPPARRPWMSEDGRMSLFDAASLALAYFALPEGGTPPPEPATIR